jgi:hypothetical protein
LDVAMRHLELDFKTSEVQGAQKIGAPEEVQNSGFSARDDF